MSRLLLASIALSLALAGCGNKGPLVLPTKPVPAMAEAVAEPPEATGDEVVPTEATERAADEPLAPVVDPAANPEAEPEPAPEEDDPEKDPGTPSDGGNG